MTEMLENYINGNLTNARQQAKRYSHKEIRTGLVNRFGYSLNKSVLTADYLKTGAEYQAACDAD